MSNSAITVISAERHERFRQFLKDLWDYRELFWTFVERDIKVRYKQTALGVIWVVLQPLFIAGAFSLIFGKVARMPSDGLPYALFYLGALVPWTTFATALSQSAQSLEANAQLVSKVYFPRLVVPGAIVWGSFLDFCIGWTLLNAVALWLGYWNWKLIAITPILVLIQAATVTGIGLVLAALNAQYRDVKHTISFLVQVMMLATPVIYPLSRLPEWAQRIMFVNPMACVVHSYRLALKADSFDWQLIGSSALMAGIYLVIGIWFFRKREARLADVL
jgi:lipopolysaccharide transport system permease protein